MNQTADNVVIVGGGFAGLFTALSLAERKDHPPILLIEPNERFLFLPLLYELLSGELRAWEIAPRYDALLAGRGIAWLRDRVESIDSGVGSVRTAAGRTLPFGRLVLACGATSHTFGVPGAVEHCLGFRTLEDVQRLQALVERLRSRRLPLQRLAVVGAGPTGVELACKLADMAGDVAVIELIERGPTHLPQARAFNREQALRALQRKDVRLRTHTVVSAVTADSLELEHRPPESDDSSCSSETLPVQGVIWTAGIEFRPPAMEPAPSRDDQGRLLCHDDLRLVEHPHVFAAGDLAHVPGPNAANGGEGALPANAQVAFQQGPALAANLIRSLRGDPLEPFRWNDLGEMMSLGRGEASLCGSGLTLSGPAAYQLRRMAYLTRLPGLSHQLKVAAGWLVDGAS